MTSAATSGLGLPVGLLLSDTGSDGPVLPADRPRFYELCTADGVRYEQIATLHDSDVLVSTVLATCPRYEVSQRCRFCAIDTSAIDTSANGESSRYPGTTPTTLAVRSASDLAEVAEAAVRLDGARQMVLTAGPSLGLSEGPSLGPSLEPDRSALHLARCVRAVTAAVPGLPVQVQIEPPGDLMSISALRRAGATTIGVSVYSLDDEVRKCWMPGRSTVSLSRYWAAWDEAVRVFGRNRVFTSLVLGLGDSPDDLVDAARLLIERGVHPLVVPLRPAAGTVAAADGFTAPAAEVLADVTARVAGLLTAAEMRWAGRHGFYGACSAMAVSGG
ncbi:MAG TPA: radical SAM protein [Pseudonocardiaceae bacterium]